MLSRILLAMSVAVSLPVCSAAATIILSPISENTWNLFHRGDNRSPSGGLYMEQGDRPAVVFDLSGISPGEIESISLTVVSGDPGSWGVNIEAIGSSIAGPLDPFVFTTIPWADHAGLPVSYESEAGPCFTSPATCPARILTNSETGAPGFSFGRALFDYTPSAMNLTDAISVLSQGPFLQLSFNTGMNSIPIGETTPPNNGTFLGWSGFGDARFPAPYLTVMTVPEPTSFLMIALGLVQLSYRRRNRSRP